MLETKTYLTQQMFMCLIVIKFPPKQDIGLDQDGEHEHVQIALMTSSNQMNGNCKPLTFD